MTSVDNFADHDNCLMYSPATRTATTTSQPVDTAPYNSATICFEFGASGDTLSETVYWTCKITECDTVGGTYTDVADAEVIDGTTSPSNSIVINAPAEDELIYKLGYKGNARYVKGVITPTGTHTYGTPISVHAKLGNKRMGPPSQASVAYAS